MNKNLDSRQIENMFSSIAPRYDFLNSLLSVGLDKYWRKKAIDMLSPESNDRILDIATGTGDILIEIASRDSSIQALGLDLSYRMIDLGRTKIKNKGYENSVTFYIANGECLPFPDNCIDRIICSFGIRNFSNVKLGLLEFYRTLKPGGIVVILEFFTPKNGLFSTLYKWYFNLILPRIGKIISGHSNAYTYLPDSVSKFPSQKTFVSWIEEAGFEKVAFNNISFGIVSIHWGYK